MITGKGSLSIRKADIASQKTPLFGLRRVVFAHKATAGDIGFDLTNLTAPTEMTDNGFSQPQATQLTAAKLKFYRNNLRIVSSSKGQLMDFMSYDVASNTRINFIGFTADANEVFIGIIDSSPIAGANVVDAQAIVKTGTLAALANDFVVGQPFALNRYPTEQVGSVQVFLDGVLQYRNTGNSTVTLDGNYWEADAGGGLSSVIHFNVSDTVDRSVMIISTGLVSERPDGSMMALIEQQAGITEKLVTAVAEATGQPTSFFRAAPAYPDLANFGNRVFDMESNRARRDATNVWTVAQPLVGRPGTGAVPIGEIGEYKESNVSVAAGVTIATGTGTSAIINITSLLLQPGIWDIYALCYAGSTATGTLNFANFGISPTSAALPTDPTRGYHSVGLATGTIDIGLQAYIQLVSLPNVVISVASTYYMITRLGVVSVTGTIKGAGTLYAFRRG